MSAPDSEKRRPAGGDARLAESTPIVTRRRGADRRVELARARWRAPWWSPSTSDALAFSRRMAALGYAVELEYADRPVRFVAVDDAAVSE